MTPERERPERVETILGRLDERTISIQENMKIFREDIGRIREEKNQQTEILQKEIQEIGVGLQGRFNSLEIDVDEKIEALKADMDDRFVSKERFNPIEKIIYGLVGLILSAVGIAVLTVVIKK